MSIGRKNFTESLYAQAEKQQGYFTTEQAKKAGFRDNTHPYHVKVGNWIREYRGIYRMARYPRQDESEMVLWSLWSRNRKGSIQGVFSHQTALSLYELSDLMPAKLHMTVPLNFRRSSLIPKILTLHQGAIPIADSEERSGYRVTKPLRTVLDLLNEGKLPEQVIKSAFKEAMRRGLISKAEIKKRSLDPKEKTFLAAIMKV